MNATGFQILFLYFAVFFGSMLASRWLMPTLALPADLFTPLSQAVTIGIAALILLVVPPLRRLSHAMLRNPMPEGAGLEASALLALKLCVPFALVGLAALSGLKAGDGEIAVRQWVASDPQKQWAHELGPFMLANRIVFACLLGPLVEEICFRGFLYRAWERQWGWLRATLLTSVAFGLVHPGQFLSTFIGSLLYVAILRRTGSLRACVYVHVGYNTLISWPLLGHRVFAERTGDPLSPSTWAVELACLAVVSVGVPVYLLMARRPGGSAASPT